MTEYGKANGNGPLHLLAKSDVGTLTLCGVRRFDAFRWPDGEVERHGICVRCTAVESAMVRPKRPDGPDTVTPAILDAWRTRQQAVDAYDQLVAEHVGGYAWMNTRPDDRRAFVAAMAEAGITFATIGRLLGVTREYVRQLHNGDGR